MYSLIDYVLGEMQVYYRGLQTNCDQCFSRFINLSALFYTITLTFKLKLMVIIWDNFSLFPVGYEQGISEMEGALNKLLIRERCCYRISMVTRVKDGRKVGLNH